MRVEIYEITGLPCGRLAVMPRPRGDDWLEDEIAALRAAGVDTLVCLLTAEEMAELGLTSEAECCAARSLEFVSFPIPDRGVPPSVPAFLAVVRRLARMLAEGKSVAIHCRQGVGRSALLAASVLTALGDEPATAFERIARARGSPVPDTPEQHAWVEQLARRCTFPADTPRSEKDDA